MKVYPLEDFSISIVRSFAEDFIKISVHGPNFELEEKRSGTELFMKGIAKESLLHNQDSVLRVIYENTYKKFIEDRENAIGLYTGKANSSGPVQVPPRRYQKNKSTRYCVRRVRPVTRAVP